ncbi:MAG TPA: AAA family ATPase [Terricaulis sp.]|nr:AAA family ATPase [Terricaulis sp.]
MIGVGEILSLPHGARFYRADLHIHSFGASHDVSDVTMTAEGIVGTALAEGLGVIAIADHNDIRNVAAALKAADGSGLFVVPAVELSTPEGHLLCYAPSTELLSRFIAQLSIADAGAPNSRCQNAMLDCLEKLKALGGFAILAHVDGPSGLDVQVPGMSPHKVDILCHSALVGLELKRSDSEISFAEGDPVPERAHVGEKRRNLLGLGARQCLARVLNSDSHTLAALGRNAQGGRRVTRVKMATPSFEALRQALEDAEARVRIEDDIPETIPQVLGVAIEGGFLDGQMVQFSPNLNCIIGGRGAGKSTLFECVRCLSRERSSSSAVDSEIWPSGLHLYWQDAAGQKHTLFRPMGGGVENADDEFTGPDSFAMESFGQSETAKISAQAQSNPTALLGYLDRFVDLEADLAAEEAARRALLDLQTEIEKAQAKVDLIPQYERALSVARQQLAALEQAKAKDVIALQRRVADERAVRQRVAEKIGELKADLASASPAARIDELRQIADPANLSLGAAEFAAILTDAAVFEAGMADADTKIRSGFQIFQGAAATQIAAWKAKDAEATRQIEEKRKELEAQGVKLDMAFIQKLANDEATHNQSVINLKTWIPQLKKLKTQRAVALRDRWAARDRVATARDAYAREASKVLEETLSDLKVSLKFVRNGSSPTAEQLIVSAMNWRTSNVQRAGWLVEHVTVPILLDAIDKKNPSSIRAVTLQDGVKPFDAKEAAAILDRLSAPDVRVGLESCHIDDLPRLKVTKAVADGAGGSRYVTRDFSKLSLGQQQSVLLALMLSANSNDPLLIDQPEDNLDSEFIYFSLVPVLRRAKERRQVIIVTHNANIAVLGDAEQIIVLKSTNEQASIQARGSIDDFATRDLACAILEGAREAFQRRARTYGYRLDAP